MSRDEYRRDNKQLVDNTFNTAYIPLNYLCSDINASDKKDLTNIYQLRSILRKVKTIDNKKEINSIWESDFGKEGFVDLDFFLKRIMSVKISDN